MRLFRQKNKKNSSQQDTLPKHHHHITTPSQQGYDDDHNNSSVYHDGVAGQTVHYVWHDIIDPTSNASFNQQKMQQVRRLEKLQNGSFTGKTRPTNLDKPLPVITNTQQGLNQQFHPRPFLPKINTQFGPQMTNQQPMQPSHDKHDNQYFQNATKASSPVPVASSSIVDGNPIFLQKIPTATVEQHEIDGNVLNANNNEKVFRKKYLNKYNNNKYDKRGSLHDGFFSKHPLQFIPDNDSSVEDSNTTPFNVQLRDSVLGTAGENEKVASNESQQSFNNVKVVNISVNTDTIITTSDIPNLNSQSNINLKTENDHSISKFLPSITQGLKGIKKQISKVSLISSSDNEVSIKPTPREQLPPSQNSFSKDSGYQSPGINNNDNYFVNQNDTPSVKNSFNSFDSNNIQRVMMNVASNQFPTISTVQRQPTSQIQFSPHDQRQSTREEHFLFYNTKSGSNGKHAAPPIATNINVINNDLSSSHNPPDIQINFSSYKVDYSTYAKPTDDSDSDFSVCSVKQNGNGNFIPRIETANPDAPVSPTSDNASGIYSNQSNAVNMSSKSLNVENSLSKRPFSSTNISLPNSIPYLFTNEGSTNSLTNATSQFNMTNNGRSNKVLSLPSDFTSPYSQFQFENDNNKPKTSRKRPISMPLQPSKSSKPLTKPHRFSFSFFRKSKQTNEIYLQATKELEEMHFHEAIRLLSQVLITYPNSYSVRCDRAYASYQLEDWARATSDLTIAINRRPKKPKAYSLRGEVYRLLGDYDKALIDLDKSLKIQKHPFALRTRAEVYSALARYDDSLNDLDTALEMEPKSIFTLTRRAKVYCSLNIYRDAIADLSKALILDPSQASNILANRGEVYRLTGRFDDALKDLDMALARGENSLALERRGAVLRSLGQENEALADFERIIQLNPRSFFAHKNRAEILLSFGNNDDALVNLDVALQLEPKNFTLLKCRGEILHLLGNYDKAIIDYDAALDIEPHDIEVLKNRGEIHRLLQNFDKAIQDFTKCLEIDPSNVYALSRRGEVFRMLREGTKALRDLDEAINLEPHDTISRESRGAVNRTFRRYEEALKDLDEALYLNPESVFALTNRGAVYFMLRRNNESLMDLNKALSLDPKNIFALETRGALYNVFKKHEDALEDLNLALELDPNNSWALSYRGEVLAALGRNDDALYDLNQVLQSLPNWGYPLALRGAVYRSMKFHTQALLDLDRAITNIRDKAFNISYETKALCNRGAVYHILGRDQEALADLNKILLREPNDILALTERSIIYSSLGEFDVALKDLEIILRFEPDNADALERKNQIERAKK
ncbi:2203_t:CDS:2 [Funneliformis geosporum]|nr:2203_t:CDS:2 [Funneliformis geosporum]